MKIYEEENKEVEDRECKKLTMVWPQIPKSEAEAL